MNIDLSKHQFKLYPDFLEYYRNVKPNWGPVGEFVFYRTYSRTKEDGSKESWVDTVQRVVEGIYTFQKAHCDSLTLPWYEAKAQKSAKVMFDKIFTFKFTPPGRGLWMMGTPYVYERGGMALNNCGAVSTKDLDELGSLPFRFIMDGLMHGVGMGFDVEGDGKLFLYEPEDSNVELFHIEDTRESWVESLGKLIDSYLDRYGKPTIQFDYSKVRPAGEPIKGFGGISSGPEPLRILHESIRTLLAKVAENIHPCLDSVDITDMFNYIGKCVVAGNVRRSAEIAIGNLDDDKFFEMKNPDKFQFECSDRRWASNNTVKIYKKDSSRATYSKVVTEALRRGDPGIMWPDNISTFGRGIDGYDPTDAVAPLINPCQVAWSKVLTPKGLKNFGDLQAGDQIWSKEGWTKVVKKWSNGVKDVSKYATTAGIFYGTGNHRVISGGKKIQVKDAESLECLEGPIWKNLELDPQDIMDGLVMGDGMVHSTHQGRYKAVCLTIGANDQDYFTSEVSHLIGNNRAKSDLDYSIQVATTTITPKELVKTYNRRVPTRFLSDPNTMAGFLRGIFTANGFVLRGARVGLCASSKGMIEDLQLMLSALGIRSYYTTDKAKHTKFSNGTFLCKESYRLNITTARREFMDKIGFIQEYKNEVPLGNVGYPHKFDYDIKEVTRISREEVFDITVDNKSHTYWTQGCNVSNCGEQNLESFELCCLVETFPSNHDNYPEYEETLKYAYLYAKTVTLINTHWPETNQVMMKNRRIGTSQSGIIDAFVKHGRKEMLAWSNTGYKYLRSLDHIYSNWLCVPKSVRVTTVKPSGTVSLLPGISPGIHYPHSEYYIRTVQVPGDSPLRFAMEEAGYEIQEIEQQGTGAVTVVFPVHEKYFHKTKEMASVWEQVKNVVDYQKYWSDNNVSCTVTIRPEEHEEMVDALLAFDDELKSLSMLAYRNDYKYPVYKEITKEEFDERSSKIKGQVDYPKILNNQDAEGEKYCSNDSCTLPLAIRDPEDAE